MNNQNYAVFLVTSIHSHHNSKNISWKERKPPGACAPVYTCVCCTHQFLISRPFKLVESNLLSKIN